MPITASGNSPALTAASNTANLAQNPNSGGIPASENMKIASAAARPGRVRDRPESEAIVSIRAIGFINDGVANVRFHRTVRQAQQTVESDWIATIAFTYTRAPMSEPDRLRNPLGFQVTSYRADPEVIR